jgi:hypothetical protein
MLNKQTVLNFYLQIAKNIIWPKTIFSNIVFKKTWYTLHQNINLTLGYM